jgi:hypothetical protein
VTLGDWLTERAEVVPKRLAARIDQALGARRDLPVEDATRNCIDAAEALLGDLLARGSSGRDSALDLLTVDALVTYAFEVASDDPGTMVERANEAARRLAAIAQS